MNMTARRAFLACPAVSLAALAWCVGGCSSGGGTTAAKPAAATGQYAFWPKAPDEPRIQFVRAIDSSEDLAPTKTSGLEEVVFGKEAAKPADVNKPYGVAMKDGKIYVCDIRGAALVVFDVPKKQTRLLGTSGVNRLGQPVAVAVADDGMIYVVDTDRGGIVVFDAEERYSTTIGVQKMKPAAIALHGERLYVSDMANHTVHVFNRISGEQVGTIGSIGDGDGQFRLPLGVAVDPKGDVWVVDMMQCRVQKFSPDGKFIKAMGELGDYAGSFARPKHIAIDADGVVYVVDAAFQNVQMFDNQMRLLMSFGAAGNFPGAMNLPAGIAVAEGDPQLFGDYVHPGFGAKRLVLVTNQFGDQKIAIYAMGQRKEGYSVQNLAAAALPVASGVGVNPEAQKMQNVGEQEPTAPPPAGAQPAAGAATPPPAAPATPAAAPTPKP